jgi:alpha-D-xyloside xylohydrolase
MLEFPDDPTCDTLDRQYMLGDSLLVAPVFSHDGDVTYYVPEGRWTNYLTGKAVEGPGWACETHDFMSLPLMVRPNTVIAVGSCEDRPDYDYGDGVTLRVYELADGERATAVIPSVAGDVDATFEVRRAGDEIAVERQGASKPWRLLLVGVESVASVKGGTVKSSPEGVMVTPAKDADRLKISLGVTPPA